MRSWIRFIIQSKFFQPDPLILIHSLYLWSSFDSISSFLELKCVSEWFKCEFNLHITFCNPDASTTSPYCTHYTLRFDKIKFKFLTRDGWLSHSKMLYHQLRYYKSEASPPLKIKRIDTISCSSCCLWWICTVYKSIYMFADYVFYRDQYAGAESDKL